MKKQVNKGISVGGREASASSDVAKHYLQKGETHPRSTGFKQSLFQITYFT